MRIRRCVPGEKGEKIRNDACKNVIDCGMTFFREKEDIEVSYTRRQIKIKIGTKK